MDKSNSNCELGEQTLKFVRNLHPEDISVGDDIAPTQLFYQYPTFLWCGVDTTILPPERKVQIAFIPCEELSPLKVDAICLPFVLCSTDQDKPKVIDVRLVNLCKLDADFASRVREAFGKATSKKKSKKKNKKSKRKGKTK